MTLLTENRADFKWLSFRKVALCDVSRLLQLQELISGTVSLLHIFERDVLFSSRGGSADFVGDRMLNKKFA